MIKVNIILQVFSSNKILVSDQWEARASTFTTAKWTLMDQYLALFSIGLISERGGGWGRGGPPDESLSASLLSSAPRVLGHTRRWLRIPRGGTDPVDALKHEFNCSAQQLVQIVSNMHKNKARTLLCVLHTHCVQGCVRECILHVHIAISGF